MSILQPGLKRVRLRVPADSSFDAVRDLDGTFAEVPDVRDKYRYLRDGVSVDFEATDETVLDGDASLPVFEAARINA
ncbi:hypothetical protein [Nocardiopsis ansamitocini]|uniref:Uncharacterized protein n=1 Tax=Nocardiopsis ansamitocini TaxID=1670832 RepID=A0A9W6UHW3_9ACTN|nr:hypothetical protein [Nocardiopsis ansamitocini]GLU47059.1 hypothetical protein Nans01_14100 [Nocardiopsis ansamitocini]